MKQSFCNDLKMMANTTYYSKLVQSFLSHLTFKLRLLRQLTERLGKNFDSNSSQQAKGCIAKNTQNLGQLLDLRNTDLHVRST